MLLIGKLKHFLESVKYHTLIILLFLKVESSNKDVKSRNILEVLKESLEDCPLSYSAESEIRYKIIIDPSEDDSLVRLLFTFRVLDRTSTRMLCCSSFKGNTRADQVGRQMLLSVSLLLLKLLDLNS